jgi:hypothetical protein
MFCVRCLFITVAITGVASCRNAEVLWQPVIIDLPTACLQGGMPNLTTTDDGRVYLSWIEFLNDSTDALYFSVLEHDRWSSPRTIATGSDWFVNWADFPSLAVFRGNQNFMAAHWLRKRGAGIYEYDVHIAISQDKGRHWRETFIPHRDSIAAEHGFASFVPLRDDRMFVTWLDGRYMGDASGHLHGPMTLRAAVFDTEGRIDREWELDPRVCECCQTSAAITRRGVVVVYRDRSEDEVRDIAIVRHDRNTWSTPQIVYPDRWQIAGCPVNGPAVAAHEDTVAIAWYCAPENTAQVKVIFSYDGGMTFGEPVRVDQGSPLGRVDLVWIKGNEMLVSWMESSPDGAQIIAARVIPQGKRGKGVVISSTTASRQSGFPVMTRSEEGVVIAWTQGDSATVVRSALMKF